MARVPVKNLNSTQLAELSCTYAALILHDEGLEITGAQIKKLVDASGNKVESFWPNIFAKALQGQNVNTLLLGGAGQAQPVAATGSSSQEKAAAPAAAAKGFKI